MSSDKNQIIKDLVDKFKIERYVYLGLIFCSFIILLISVTKLLFFKDPDPDVNQIGEISTLIGSFSTMVVSLGQIFKMYNRAMDSLDKT
jgi:hypothetical protein